jgi:hypothetical protein
MTLHRLPAIFLALFALLTGLAFTHSPGTTDFEAWQNWVNNAVTHGLVARYACCAVNYPPLAFVILWAAEQVFHPLQVGTFLSVKFSIFLFLILTTFLFWLWTRDLKVTLILYFALLLNSVALGYIDIYFAPGLILSLWMLEERRWVWFSLFFALTCLTKWQPLIIGPYILLYVLGIQNVRQVRQVEYTALFGQAVLPAAVVTGLVLVVFGAQPVLGALRTALSAKALSGEALNLNWIVTHFLQLLDAKQFGGLQNGLATYIRTDWPHNALLPRDIENVAIDSYALLFWIPRLLFWSTYLLALALFFRSEKTFSNLLIFAGLGYLCYFMFNTGVHENHLFLVAVLAVVLYWREATWRVNAVILLLMTNINLFLFYGVDGQLHFPRLFAGIDMALPLAVLNVLFFVWLYGRMLAEVVGAHRHSWPVGKALETTPFQSFRRIALWLGMAVLGVVLALLWRSIGAQL